MTVRPYTPETLAAEEVREMVCPVCGYTCRTSSIGAVFCGPHGQGATTTPAVRMLERARGC
jgi:hypothetical protein